MNITLSLSTAESIALRRLASEQEVSLAGAAYLGLREFLISAGYLEPEHELDEETETAGNA